MKSFEKGQIKVLNISEEGRFAGPQRRVCNIAPILMNRYNIEVQVLFPRQHSQQFQKSLRNVGITYYVRSLHKLTKQWWHLILYLLLFVPEVIKICGVIRKSKPDIVESNNGSWCIKAIIAARLCGVRNIWYLNDTYMPKFIVGIFNFVYKCFSSKNFMFASNRTKEFYFPKEKLNQLNKFVTIQAPVNADFFSPDETYHFPFPDCDYKGIRIITTGNVNPVKNHQLIIRLAKKFQDNYPDFEVRFYIVGYIYESQKYYYQELLKIARDLGVDNVKFIGGSTKIRELLYYSDIYICSSSYEGSPNAVWEALSMGKAVLSTDVGDVKEIFDRHNCGLTCNKEDHTQCASQLYKLIKDDVLRNEMGLNARRVVLQEFDINIAAAKYAQFYQDVIEETNLSRCE